MGGISGSFCIQWSLKKRLCVLQFDIEVYIWWNGSLLEAAKATFALCISILWTLTGSCDSSTVFKDSLGQEKMVSGHHLYTARMLTLNV